MYLDYKPFSMLGGEVEVLNQLNQAEQRYNSALKPHIDTQEDMLHIEQTIARIEHYSEILRRQAIAAADDFG